MFGGRTFAVRTTVVATFLFSFVLVAAATWFHTPVALDVTPVNTHGLLFALNSRRTRGLPEWQNRQLFSTVSTLFPENLRPRNSERNH